jgi:hypothetical protein
MIAIITGHMAVWLLGIAIADTAGVIVLEEGAIVAALPAVLVGDVLPTHQESIVHYTVTVVIDGVACLFRQNAVGPPLSTTELSSIAGNEGLTLDRIGWPCSRAAL